MVQSGNCMMKILFIKIDPNTILFITKELLNRNQFNLKARDFFICFCLFIDLFLFF